ncbi:MAG: hypothetical protein FJ318_07570 [SAR202 cluster bacterium]|nr:hypothetical protein [SAR202 cluster bacterium]
MVIGKERTSWYKDHPLACTCADCTKARASKLAFQAANPEWHKIGRNEPCPCGSGKKFKKCHGATM